MQAASQNIQPSNHPEEVIDLHQSPLYLGACRLDKWQKEGDGLTLRLWYGGLSLVWDATVVDTFAQGHYKDSARQAGLLPQNDKSKKYHDFQSNYHF